MSASFLPPSSSVAPRRRRVKGGEEKNQIFQYVETPPEGIIVYIANLKSYCEAHTRREGGRRQEADEGGREGGGRGDGR